MHGVDSHYDAANTGRRSSAANRSLKARGHCWVMLGVVLPLPFRSPEARVGCLPLLFRLYVNTKAARRHGRTYRSRPDLARELLALVCGHWPDRRFHVLADSAYGGQDTLRTLPLNCDLSCQWQLNARLLQPLQRPLQRCHRHRKRGEALPSAEAMLNEQHCRHIELKGDGRRDRPYRLASVTACLYTVPDRPVRIVATERLTAGGKPLVRNTKPLRRLYYSTDTSAAAEQILAWYRWRWPIEVAIRDAKQELGFSLAQGWTRAAVERTAPCLMLLRTLIVLWFTLEGHRFWQRQRRRLWPWYPHKPIDGVISFADMLATLRECTIRQHLGHSLKPRAVLKGSTPRPTKVLRTLLHLVRLT